MKKRIFLVTLLMLTVLASLPAYSQSHTETRDSSKIEQFIIHYRVNEIELDADYMDNKAQLHRIRHYFANSPRIDSVTIYSWASPEGGIKFNTYLSRERGKTAKALLLSLSPDSAKFTQVRSSSALSRKTGLVWRKLSKKDTSDTTVTKSSRYSAQKESATRHENGVCSS